MWWPLSSRWVTGYGAGTRHAIDLGVAVKAKEPADLVAVCGATCTGLSAAGAITAEGDDNGSLALAWPPFARGATTRCRACYTATGRPKVADTWRRLLDQDQVDAIRTPSATGGAT